MGARYANITVYGVSQEELVNYLSSKGFDSYVSPTENNFTTIYDNSFEIATNIGSDADAEKMYQGYAKLFKSYHLDSEHNLQWLKYAIVQSQDGLAKIRHLDRQASELLKQYSGTTEGILVCWASHLSRKFSCPALAVYVRDDSQFWYHLSKNGKMIDEYTTYAEKYWQPGQGIVSELGSEIKGGDARGFCSAFDKENKVDEVEVILHKPYEFGVNYEFTHRPQHEALLNVGAFPDAIARHQALAMVLGITPWWVLYMSYGAIAQGEAKDYFDDYVESYGLSSEEAMLLLKQAEPQSAL